MEQENREINKEKEKQNPGTFSANGQQPPADNESGMCSYESYKVYILYFNLAVQVTFPVVSRQMTKIFLCRFYESIKTRIM
jgi:hypothetical protein